MADATKPVLYLIACGGGATSDLPSLIGLLLDQDWDICVFATPAGMAFLDVAAVEELTGHVVRHRYDYLRTPDALPPPHVMVVAPATFNTITKLALGISDTLALGLLNKAIGLSMPVLVCPTPGPGLVRHPLFAKHIEVLRGWGVRVLHGGGEYVLPLLDLAGDYQRVPWEAVSEEVARLRPGAVG